MKSLNFTAKEVLPSLLDRTKGQTIRPAWKSIWGVAPSVEFREHKQPRFKVGDEIKLFWKQRSKYEWFKISDGEPHRGSFKYDLSKSKLGYAGLFNKVLGTGKITEIFEIKMIKYNESYFISIIPEERTKELLKKGIDVVDIAKKDGFKSKEEMFAWFERYDLSKPKKFYVYRFKWR